MLIISYYFNWREIFNFEGIKGIFRDGEIRLASTKICAFSQRIDVNDFSERSSNIKEPIGRGQMGYFGFIFSFIKNFCC